MPPKGALVELAGFAAVGTVLVWVCFVLVLTLFDSGTISLLVGR